MATIPPTSAAAGPRTRAPSGRPASPPATRAAVRQLEALLELAGCSAVAGVVELTLDVSTLDLTDSTTRRVLVAVASALQAPEQRLTLVGITLNRLGEALHAASSSEMFALRAALHGSPVNKVPPRNDTSALSTRGSALNAAPLEPGAATA